MNSLELNREMIQHLFAGFFTRLRIKDFQNSKFQKHLIIRGL